MQTGHDIHFRSGFTIVELLIVIIVIAILATLSIVAYTGIQNRARVAVLQSDLSSATTQLGAENAINGRYPSDEEVNNGIGLTASTSTTWEYTYTSETNSYCLTGTNSGISYYISSINTTPTAGACTGHNDGGVVALTCPTGYIIVPGNSTFSTSDFCVMKYEAKNVGSVATSQASGIPWVSISQTSAISTAQAACAGCHLITEAERMTIAANILSVPSNWSSGTVGTGYVYQGHIKSNPASALVASTNDAEGLTGMTSTGSTVGNNSRRTLTLTNSEVIWDFAGNVWEWTAGTIGASSGVGISGEANCTMHQWTASMSWGSFPALSRPSAISGTVGGYTSSQGIGQICTHYGNSATRAFLRGGAWADASGAGVLALDLDASPSSTGANMGYRVAK